MKETIGNCSYFICRFDDTIDMRNSSGNLNCNATDNLFECFVLFSFFMILKKKKLAINMSLLLLLAFSHNPYPREIQSTIRK